MEEIKNSIQELKILLNSIGQNSNIQTLGDDIEKLFASRNRTVNQLKDDLRILEEDFNTASTKPESFKSELIRRMVNIKAQALYYINNVELSRALNEQLDEIERKAQEITNNDADLSHASDELLIIKEEYDSILELGKKSKTTLNNYNIEMTIAKAIVKVMGLKIAGGIEVDLNKEIDKKYAHEVLLHIQETAKRLQETGTDEQKESAKKLLGKIGMTSLINANKGLENIENLVYDKELMQNFFNLTLPEKQESKELIKNADKEEQHKSDEEDLSFAEYRKRKIAYYQALTGKKRIEPGKYQITIITADNKVKKLNNEYMFKDIAFAPTSKFNPIAIIFGKGIRTISGSAGEYPKSIRDVILNDGLKSIEHYAFSNTGIEELILPPTVEGIYNSAFKSCHKLKHVKFNEGLINIGSGRNEEVFTDTNIEELNFPSTLKIIGENAFSNCSELKNVGLNEGLEVIGPAAFARTAIEEIKMPKSLKSIGEEAFLNCSELKNVGLNEGLEVIGPSAFERTSIEDIKMPQSLRQIGDKAFYFCQKLRNVALNDGLEIIGDSAFQATSLQEVKVPKTIRGIGRQAFKFGNEETKINETTENSNTEQQVTRAQQEPTADELVNSIRAKQKELEALYAQLAKQEENKKILDDLKEI